MQLQRMLQLPTSRMCAELGAEVSSDGVPEPHPAAGPTADEVSQTRGHSLLVVHAALDEQQSGHCVVVVLQNTSKQMMK